MAHHKHDEDSSCNLNLRFFATIFTLHESYRCSIFSQEILLRLSAFCNLLNASLAPSLFFLISLRTKMFFHWNRRSEIRSGIELSCIFCLLEHSLSEYECQHLFMHSTSFSVLIQTIYILPNSNDDICEIACVWLMMVGNAMIDSLRWIV